MKYRFFSIALTAAALLMGMSQPQAAGDKAASPQLAASQVKPSTPKAAGKAPASAPVSKSKAAIAPKATVKVKLVDINSASGKELKKLPGISDAEAAKIIAGRPYGSKAWLVSNNILPEDKYGAVRDLIIARQPYRDPAKNAALYRKKK